MRKICWEWHQRQFLITYLKADLQNKRLKGGKHFPGVNVQPLNNGNGIRFFGDRRLYASISAPIKGAATIVQSETRI